MAKSNHAGFICFGQPAHKLAKKVTAGFNKKDVTIIHTPHPSPLSAHRGFFGSKPFTTFNTTIRNNTFTFTNLEAATIVPSGNNYSLSGLQIVEGSPRTLSYVSLGTGPDEKFVIPDRDIDTSTLKIKVQGSTSNTFVNTYTQTSDISNVNPSSKVFCSPQVIVPKQITLTSRSVLPNFLYSTLLSLQYCYNCTL